MKNFHSATQSCFGEGIPFVGVCEFRLMNFPPFCCYPLEHAWIVKVKVCWDNVDWQATCATYLLDFSKFFHHLMDLNTILLMNKVLLTAKPVVGLLRVSPNQPFCFCC